MPHDALGTIQASPAWFAGHTLLDFSSLLLSLCHRLQGGQEKT